MRNGYDPLMPGGTKTQRTYAPVEAALTNGMPLEQPLIAGTLNEVFVVSNISSTDAKQHILTGTAESNTTALLFIYSQMPLVLTVKTDDTGQWTYALDEQLNDGQHMVYVAVTDTTGRIQKKSNPFAFYVSRAEAAPLTNFIDDEPIATPEPTSSFSRYYLAGSFVAVALALVGVLIILRKRHHSYE